MSRSHRLTELPEKCCGHIDACNLSQKELCNLQHTFKTRHTCTVKVLSAPVHQLQAAAWDFIAG